MINKTHVYIKMVETVTNLVKWLARPYHCASSVVVKALGSIPSRGQVMQLVLKLANVKLIICIKYGLELTKDCFERNGIDVSCPIQTFVI